MAYPKTEQETVLVYEAESNAWNAYSTVPKHIRKLQAITQVTVVETDDYGPKAVRALLTEKQVRMVAERKLTDEQRQAMAKRMRERRANIDSAVENTNED